MPQFRPDCSAPANSKLQAAAPAPEIYLPYSQGLFSFPVLTIAVRTDGSSTQPLIPALRAAVAEGDADQPVFDIKTMGARVDESNAADRFQLLLLVIFGGLSLLLAAVGLYGVVDHSVSQRTQLRADEARRKGRPDDRAQVRVSPES